MGRVKQTARRNFAGRDKSTDPHYMRRLGALHEANKKNQAQAPSSNPSPGAAFPTPAEQNQGGWADLPEDLLRKIVAKADKANFTREALPEDEGIESVSVPCFRGPQAAELARLCCQTWWRILQLRLGPELPAFAVQRNRSENRMGLVATKPLAKGRYMYKLIAREKHVGKAFPKSAWYHRIPLQAFQSPGGVPYAQHAFCVGAPSARGKNFYVDVVFEPEIQYAGDTIIRPDYGCAFHSNCVLETVWPDMTPYPKYDGKFTIHEAPEERKTRDMSKAVRKLVESFWRYTDVWMRTKEPIQAGNTLVIEYTVPGVPCPKCVELHNRYHP